MAVSEIGNFYEVGSDIQNPFYNTIPWYMVNGSINNTALLPFSLQQSLGCTGGFAESVTTYGNDVYIGGFLETGVETPGYWLNRNWQWTWVSLTPPGWPYNGGRVYSIVVPGGNVYAGGDIDGINDVGGDTVLDIG